MIPEPEAKVLHVAYVGPVDFGSSSAEAQRMLGVTQALLEAGDRVSIGSATWPEPSFGAHQANEHAAAASGRTLTVTQLGEFPRPEWPKLRRVWRGLSWGAATRTWLSELQPAPDVIVLYGTSLGYLVRLLPLARHRHLPLVLDVVEWYQPSHLPGGRFGPFALANAVAMRVVAPRVAGVIVISRFLERYFTFAGTPSLRVPPLFEVAETPHLRPREWWSSPGHGHPLTLSYLGSAGRKDAATIRSLVCLPGLLGLTAEALCINIVGLTAQQAATLLRTPTVTHECLRFHGRLPADTARAVLADSHFSVLQRGLERFAAAGYPSKVVESLVRGVPVLANLTSDLGDVLIDGVNARILPDESPTALADAVRRALQEPYTFDRTGIASAERHRFAPRTHSQPLHDFLRSLVHGEAPS
ncbi:glycosyltransferase [Cryobacterium sp. CG_9.6]|uniref:glycosyltransferase n=1 Tax=Cryobacterium sp. CG_9.6 TaxID=2760710 RepID=UPI0024749547|nr:glycosyltransferase [Cryobacterium sp. CG_9.6]MDH6235813.1 hypothetical protein [Cryobacterium sp. CG_9.6]